jgi:hypothetical protein
VKTIVLSTVLLIAAAAALAAEIDPALLAGMKARAIGPVGMSGRIADIDAVEPDPATVFVGAATGGVWKSVNGGLTFTPIFDDQRPYRVMGGMQDNGSWRGPSAVWARGGIRSHQA